MRTIWNLCLSFTTFSLDDVGNLQEKLVSFTMELNIPGPNLKMLKEDILRELEEL